MKLKLYTPPDAIIEETHNTPWPHWKVMFPNGWSASIIPELTSYFKYGDIDFDSIDWTAIDLWEIAVIDPSGEFCPAEYYEPVRFLNTDQACELLVELAHKS
jgi:hypothetical protein